MQPVTLQVEKLVVHNSGVDRPQQLLPYSHASNNELDTTLKYQHAAFSPVFCLWNRACPERLLKQELWRGGQP
ncbi:hypothetical protein WG66_016450 [Moniliophthora roreri]|nr:hypothetical protein WG66_016450 [Moniliophthora roreri]